MAFCTKCGRQLQDGEVCNCQQTTTQQAQPIQPQQAAPAAPAQPNAAGEAFKGVFSLAKGLLKTPSETTASAVQKPNPIVSCIIIGIVALVKGLFDMFSAMVSNAQSGSSSLGDLGSLFGYVSSKPNYFLIFLASFLIVIGVAAVSALVYMLLSNVLGGCKLTYVQGLEIAAMTVIFVAVSSPVAFIIGAIPVGFFGALAGWITTFVSVLGTVYAFLAVKSVVVKQNGLPYIFACVAVANAIVSYILGFIRG